MMTTPTVGVVMTTVKLRLATASRTNGVFALSLLEVIAVCFADMLWYLYPSQ